ncbi:MAG: hypothetical protein P1V97_24940, partial [Planctomycetota bacterium]|nr:hypothetical protein [Planctomycetota bacterium]
QQTYYFCTDQCRQSFQEKPDQYLTRSCLVCQSDGTFTPVKKDDSLAAVWQEKTYYLCSTDHRGRFLADPAGYFMHSMWGIPNWLYYSSIALLLLLSFTLIERPSKRKSGPRALPMAGETKREIDDKIDLTNISWVSWMFTSRYLRFTLQLIVTFLFVVVISAGLFGSQLPGKNIAPLLTWTVWWCGLVLIILYAGKAWCYVCPWDAIAGWAESMRFWGPSKNSMGLNLKWPKAMRNIWPATIMFILLTWAELGFAITMSPRATAYMGLAMVGMAFVSVFLFEKKSFCRYGCLVGRISGLYALFSPVEIRAKDLSACATCDDKGCFKGSDKGDPCPTSQFLPTMENNTYCISCMECFHTCDKNNVSVNLRPWGSDLATLHKPRSDEAYLALIMLSLTAFHGLTMTRIWQDTQDYIASALNIGHTLAFS